MESFDDRIVIDTCALVNARVADTLLRLAQGGAHKVFWTRRIQSSTERVQLHNGWEPRIVSRFHAKLAEAFPDAVVEGHEKWIEQCTNAEGDRHVLACAIEAGARYIVTFNIRDFQENDLAPWCVRALTPNDYLLMLYLKDEALFGKRLADVALKKRKTVRELATGLLRDCRGFAELILRKLPEAGLPR